MAESTWSWSIAISRRRSCSTARQRATGWVSRSRGPRSGKTAIGTKVTVQAGERSIKRWLTSWHGLSLGARSETLDRAGQCRDCSSGSR